jgi:Tfp pilus assembly protein PilO
MKYNSNTSKLLYLLITNNQNENSQKNSLVVMSLLAILIVVGAIWFYLKPKYEGEVQLKVFRTKQQYILMTLGSSYLR